MDAELLRGLFQIHEVEQIGVERTRECRAARRVLIHHANDVFAQIRRERHPPLQRRKEQRRADFPHEYRLRPRRQQREPAEPNLRRQPVQRERLRNGHARARRLAKRPRRLRERADLLRRKREKQRFIVKRRHRLLRQRAQRQRQFRAPRVAQAARRNGGERQRKALFRPRRVPRALRRPPERRARRVPVKRRRRLVVGAAAQPLLQPERKEQLKAGVHVAQVEGKARLDSAHAVGQRVAVNAQPLRRAPQIQPVAQIRAQAADILRILPLVQPRKRLDCRVAKIRRAEALRPERRPSRAQKRRFAVRAHVVERAPRIDVLARLQRDARLGEAAPRRRRQRKRPAQPRAQPAFRQNPLDFRVPRLALRLVIEQDGQPVFGITRKRLPVQKPFDFFAPAFNRQAANRPARRLREQRQIGISLVHRPRLLCLTHASELGRAPLRRSQRQPSCGTECRAAGCPQRSRYPRPCRPQSNRRAHRSPRHAPD